MKKITKVYYILDKEDKKKVLAWLIDNDKSMRDYAKELGVSCSFLSDLLNGNRYLTEKYYNKLIEILK